jgi:hypothetical protein
MDTNTQRPTAPNLTGLSETAKASALERFEEAEARYVDQLLAKPSGLLTAEEQSYLIKGVVDWSRREGR